MSLMRRSENDKRIQVDSDEDDSGNPPTALPTQCRKMSPRIGRNNLTQHVHHNINPSTAPRPRARERKTNLKAELEPAIRKRSHV
ncbi:hypothetical protein LDENG_00038840 [Lucifuga dentata]|nr:hypothetical protein LDENG_00038840 [Lucifuga dentata]